MERFLLIGGTGHIGYAIVNEINNLREKKINITILSRNKHLPIHFPKNNEIDFIQYDPKDINEIKKIIQYKKPKTIIYLASDNNNSNSADSFNSAEVNLFLPIKILFIIKEISTDIKYIFLSSRLSKLDHNDICLYSLNKRYAEDYIEKFSIKYNLQSISIKSPTLFGPGDCSKKRLISSYIQGLLCQSKVIVQDDLQKKISIVYSKDFANIFIKAIMTDDFKDFYKFIDSKAFSISISDLLAMINIIHNSYSESEKEFLSVKFIKNNKKINNYEILYMYLKETYNFLLCNT